MRVRRYRIRQVAHNHGDELWGNSPETLVASQRQRLDEWLHVRQSPSKPSRTEVPEMFILKPWDTPLRRYTVLEPRNGNDGPLGSGFATEQVDHIRVGLSECSILSLPCVDSKDVPQ